MNIIKAVRNIKLFRYLSLKKPLRYFEKRISRFRSVQLNRSIYVNFGGKFRQILIP